MSGANFTVIADDYGLSPGVNRAIRELIALGKLTGTSCMTLFPEWADEAAALKSLCDKGLAEAGLHMTLTDFAPLSGKGPLGGDAMPTLANLLKANAGGQVSTSAVEKELDVQLDAFEAHFGRMPAYLDGHQHVHFLPAVRGWLEKSRDRLTAGGNRPWLRGSPAIFAAPGWKMKSKAAIAFWLARGFDREMKSLGYSVRGPLLGFYNWRDPENFPPAFSALTARQAGGLVMCHPGYVDQTLQSRDQFVDGREMELAVIKAGKLQAVRPNRSRI